mgnify:CR=1 FL=1
MTKANLTKTADLRRREVARRGMKIAVAAARVSLVK